MIINFFKIAFRNLLRSKGFSFINITGLAVGMASAILILLWIQNEVSYDKFYSKSDRIYTLNNRDKFNGDLWAWSTTPKILGPTIEHENPEVESMTRTNRSTFLLSLGEKHINVPGLFTDTAFFNVFGFPLLQGNASTALKTVYSMVITQKLAVKLFGSENPMGKIIRVDSNANFTVTGVMKDLPNNTSFNFEYLLPWSYMTKLGNDDQYWGNNSVKTFVLLKPGVSQAAFDRKIENTTINHTKDGSDHSTTRVFTQLFSDTHLYSKSENGKYVGSAVEKVKLFAIIAGFILLIACINFMNLSTARSEKRAKEVGIRKVIGGTKSTLIWQFLGESVLLSFMAAILALVIVELSLPAFNLLVNKQLFIDFRSSSFWLLSAAFILLTGLLAGSYPALYLSSFRPASVLKGTFKASTALVTPRKVLVVMQFTFAIALIICTIIVEHQINYAQNRDSGYSKDRLVYTFIQGDIEKHYDLIKNDLISSGAAIAVTKSMSPVTQHYSDGWGVTWPGSTDADSKTDFIRMSTDADFVITLGIHLVQGRDIDIKKYVADSTAILLNESAVKVMRLSNPLGQIVKDNGIDWHIVGVLKDFIFDSPYEKIDKLIVFGPKSWFNVVHFKLNPAHTTQEDLRLAENVFKKYNPDYPFDYNFIDQAYAKKFDDEKRTGSLAALFAGLTIFISCLGLFGLATYMAENRIKEIGVRKVLGASVAGITTLLSKDFLKLVILSFLIASPIAYFAMHTWLSTYTYRINIQWWVFAMAGLLSVIIAIVTVSYQAIRAATSNPVDSLRSK